MNNFNDLRSIWQNQASANLPDMEAVKKAVDKSRRQLVSKKILGLVTLTGTVIFIGYIGLAADFKFITTKLGIVLIIISIIGAIVLNSQMLQLILKGADSAANNQAYLQQLIRYRSKQRFFETRGIAVYYLLLTLGFMFYLYEFYARNAAFGLKAYALTLLWIAFAWFYLRPRAIKKQNKKIDELIAHVESISAQLKE